MNLLAIFSPAGMGALRPRSRARRRGADRPSAPCLKGQRQHELRTIDAGPVADRRL
jgi:hypothetical protein